MSSEFPDPFLDQGLMPFKKSAVDVICGGIVPMNDVINFVSGCSVLAEEIKKEAPDMLVVPLRGSSPMQWMAENFLEGSGLMPDVVRLPVGSYMYFKEGAHGKRNMNYKGVKSSEKQRIVDQALGVAETEGLYVPGESKLMIVDEVQYGSTIVDITRAVIMAMRSRGDEGEVSVFSFKDDRLAAERIEKYKNISANLRVRDLGTTVNALFTVDAPSLLDGIYNTNPEVPVSLDTLRVLENKKARELFRVIYEAHSNPDFILKSIDEYLDMPSNGTQENGNSALANVLNELSNVDDLHKVSRNQFLGWVRSLIRKTQA